MRRLLEPLFPRRLRRLAVLGAVASITATIVAFPTPQAGAVTADKLVFTTQPPAHVTAGQPFGPVVVNVTLLGVPVPGESIHLTDGTGQVSADTTSDTNGNATFNGVTINIAGPDTLTATDNADSSVMTVSNQFTVDPGPPAFIAFDQQPTDTPSGQTITPAVKVFVGDGVGGGRGNPVPSIDVTLSKAAGSGTLSGTTTQTTDSSGVATFNDLSIDTPDTYTLLATASGGRNPTKTSSAFAVSAGPPAFIAFDQQPTDTQSGQTITPAVKVFVGDGVGGGRGNPLPGIDVTLSIASGSGTLSGTTIQTTDSTGTATFNDLRIVLPDTYTLLAKVGGGNPSKTSSQFTVSAGPPAVVAFDQQPMHTVIGHVIAPAVTVFVGDGVGGGNGNPVPGIHVTLSIASGSGTLSGTTSQTTDSTGTATFGDLSIGQQGTFTLLAKVAGGPSTTSDPFLIDICDITLGAGQTGTFTATNQVICAYGGNDTVKGFMNGDTVVGRGTGNTVDFSSSPVGVNINLATGIGTDASGNAFTIQGMQNVTGSSHDDFITANSPVNGKIAFDRGPSTHADVYTVNPDGTGTSHIVVNSHDDYDPSWSPTGASFAFASNRSGNYEVYSAERGGAGLSRLTTGRAFDGMVDWSPDGKRIAFVSGRAGNYEIYTMTATGKGVTRLTHNRTSDFFPTWSPDGSRIAFESNRGGGFEIYSMNADGTDVRKLTDTLAPNIEPAWSPDAATILFMRKIGGTYQLFTMNADGTGQTRITSDSANNFDPSWSADGTRIVFTSDRDGTFDLFTANPDGTGLAKVTATPALDEFPSWQATCSVPGANPINCGASVPNVIRGGGGNDVIFGGKGDDRIFGGPGDDVIAGGAGSDLVNGGGGDDVIAGGPGIGVDFLRGGAGADLLDAKDGAGHDHLNGGPGADHCLADGGDGTVSC